MANKVGRPTNNPKPYRITIRMDQECRDTLDAYMMLHQVSEMEAVRRGIKLLKSN